MSDQPKFIEKAKETYRFHRLCIVSDEGWTKKLTAKKLRRSEGSIIEDIMIASWCRTHEKEIEKFKYAHQALKYIRGLKKKQAIAELD